MTLNISRSVVENATMNQLQSVEHICAMDLLKDVEDLLGNVESWPKYIIYNMLVQEPNPSSVKKAVSYIIHSLRPTLSWEVTVGSDGPTLHETHVYIFSAKIIYQY